MGLVTNLNGLPHQPLAAQLMHSNSQWAMKHLDSVHTDLLVIAIVLADVTKNGHTT